MSPGRRTAHSTVRPLTARGMTDDARHARPGGQSMLRRALTVLAGAALLSGISIGTIAARGPAGPAYQTVTVGPYGGEPSIASDAQGHLYIATPSGGTITYLSGDRGKTWAQTTT